MVDILLEKRGKTAADVKLKKLGIDSGRGFMKVCTYAREIQRQGF